VVPIPFDGPGEEVGDFGRMVADDVCVDLTPGSPLCRAAWRLEPVLSPAP